MMTVLVHNLMYYPLLTIFFFGWPIVAAGVVRKWGRENQNAALSFWGALYYSVAKYFGVDVQKAHPRRFKWLKLLHRFVGILAWA